MELGDQICRVFMLSPTLNNCIPREKTFPASLHSAPADQKKAGEILSMYEATLPFSLPVFFIKHGTFPVC